MTQTLDNKPKITCKPGTFGHLLKVSTINEAAVNAFPRWLVTTCYGLILFGIYLTILKGVVWIVIVFAAVALFLLIQYGMKPAQQLIRFLESNDDAWMRYSGIPQQALDPKLLNQSVEKLDRQREKFQRALAAKTGEDFRQLVDEVDFDGEAEATPLNALEAMQQHLASWDSSLFFAGSSRSGKTTASQHYAAVLKPFYFSLKPDYMPKGVMGVQGSMDSPEELYYWLLPFYQEFKYRVKHRLTDEEPLWIFIDELETQLSSLERSDKQKDKEATKLLPEVVGMVNSILKLGNAHKVRLGLITQSVLSKNTKLDTDSMAGLSWLLCGSELGGFGAFKSDRIKSRCSETTMGQVKLMIDHPNGVRGFWWLMELKGNFRLIEAPAPLAETELEQIPHFDPSKHPYQGRQLAPGEEVDLNQPPFANGAGQIPEQPHNGKGRTVAAKANFGQSIKTGLGKLRDGIRHGLGIDEDDMVIDTTAQTITPLEEELRELRSLFHEDLDLLKEFEEIAPVLPSLDETLQGVVLFSMRNGAVTAKHVVNFGPSKGRLYRPIKAEGVKQLFNELEAMGIGAISQLGADDPNPYYQALKFDGRTFSPNS